jgi:hypothetical protein
VVGHCRCDADAKRKDMQQIGAVEAYA